MLPVTVTSAARIRQPDGEVVFNAFQQDMLIPYVTVPDAMDAPTDGTIEAWWDEREPSLREALVEFFAAPPEPTEPSCGLQPGDRGVHVAVPVPLQLIATTEHDLVKEIVPEIREAVLLAVGHYTGTHAHCLRGAFEGLGCPGRPIPVVLERVETILGQLLPELQALRISFPGASSVGEGGLAEFHAACEAALRAYPDLLAHFFALEPRPYEELSVDPTAVTILTPVDLGLQDDEEPRRIANEEIISQGAAAACYFAQQHLGLPDEPGHDGHKVILGEPDASQE